MEEIINFKYKGITNDNFKKYDADELEKMLLESQKDKFKPSYPYKTEAQYTKEGQRIDIG